MDIYNYKQIALESRLDKLVVKREFEQELKIPQKISSNISKILIGSTTANPRLLINLVIIFFNIFESNVGISLLFFLIEERFHNQLKSCLTVLQIKNYDSYDKEFYSILEKVLND